MVSTGSRRLEPTARDKVRHRSLRWIPCLQDLGRAPSQLRACLLPHGQQECKRTIRGRPFELTTRARLVELIALGPVSRMMPRVTATTAVPTVAFAQPYKYPGPGCHCTDPMPLLIIGFHQPPAGKQSKRPNYGPFSDSTTSPSRMGSTSRVSMRADGRRKTQIRHGEPEIRMARTAYRTVLRGASRLLRARCTEICFEVVVPLPPAYIPSRSQQTAAHSCCGECSGKATFGQKFTATPRLWHRKSQPVSIHPSWRAQPSG
ncbi:hypothetical protein VTO73DRAFT_12501 [Trametes versicolor]